jgi:hypothetical protein
MVQGSVYGAYGVQGKGYRVQGLACRVSGSGSEVEGRSGSNVERDAHIDLWALDFDSTLLCPNLVPAK